MIFNQVAPCVVVQSDRGTLALTGSQSSTGCSSAPVNPAGATPMMVKVRSPSSMVRPITPGSPPKRRCQLP